MFHPGGNFMVFMILHQYTMWYVPAEQSSWCGSTVLYGLCRASEHQECGHLTGTKTSVGVIDFTCLQQISPWTRQESAMVHPSSLIRDGIPRLGMQNRVHTFHEETVYRSSGKNIVFIASGGWNYHLSLGIYNVHQHLSSLIRNIYQHQRTRSPDGVLTSPVVVQHSNQAIGCL